MLCDGKRLSSGVAALCYLSGQLHHLQLHHSLFKNVHSYVCFNKASSDFYMEDAGATEDAVPSRNWNCSPLSAVTSG